MKEITTGSMEAGQRLDKWLMKYMDKAPKSFVYKMLRKKNIKLNGKKATGSEKLASGDVITLYLADQTIAEFSSQIALPRMKSQLDIIYEDEHIMLINKPVGMLSQKARPEDISVVEHLTASLIERGELSESMLERFSPAICNRLDRNTSGIIIAGKSMTGLQEMAALLKERELAKYYRCIVIGELKEERQIDGWLWKDEAKNTVQILTAERPGARYIRTRYIPLGTADGFTYLEVGLLTGRSHQIRAHLAAIGHPLIGDYKYGRRSVNEDLRKSFGLKTQLLHSYRLEMPTLNGTLSYLSGRTFTAPLPELFQNILKEKRLG